MDIISRAAQCFAAGAYGGLINGLAVWGFGALGITPALGSNITPALTIPWLMPRLFFGGLWGLAFLLPVYNDRPYLKCCVISLAPSAYMMFKVFPQMGQGIMGLALGNTTPLFVLFFNVLWGLAAAALLESLQRPDRS